MIQRAVISDSRFSFNFLYFGSIHQQTTTPLSFRHRSTTPSCFPANVQQRLHPRPAHIHPLTSNRAHILDPLTSHRTTIHYRFTTTTPPTSKTRSHPRPARIQPRSHPMTLHPTTLPSYATQRHTARNSTIKRRLTSTVWIQSTSAPKQGTSLVYGFPARFSRLVAFCARVPAQPPRARDGGRAIRARGQG